MLFPGNNERAIQVESNPFEFWRITMLQHPIPPWPCFTDEEATAVSKILLSNKVNYWTGTEGKTFEEEFACWCNTKHAVAVANGTVALDAALTALSITSGDEIIVTSRTFIASVSSIVNVGAKPVFADINRDSQNITATTIEPLITHATKAIICVHLAGWPCDMDEITELADKHGLYIIEDCAQAHGAKYKDKPVGSIGDIGTWSFCQDKIITTGGEGGMITTNSTKLFEKIWSYKDHGKSWNTVYKKKHPPGFRWLHESFGTNLRLTEMQATIGRIQLKRIDQWHLKRLTYAQTIWNTARGLPALRVPVIPPEIEHAAYKCYVFLDKAQLKPSWNRSSIMEDINKQGIPCFSGSCSEVYLEKAFDSLDCRPKKRLKIAKELGETSLMFLIHPSLTKQHIEYTCSALSNTMQKASL